MNTTNFDNLLETLLEMDTDTPRREMVDESISIDQRVDLLLRAMFGSDRVFTPDERATARARVLDAMAADLERQISAKTVTRRRETSPIRIAVAPPPPPSRNPAPRRRHGAPASYSAHQASSSRSGSAVVSMGAHDELKGTASAAASGEWSKPYEINGHQYVATLGKSREIVLHGNYFDPSWKSLRLGAKDYALCDDGLADARRCKGLGVGGFEKALKIDVKPEFVK